MARKGGFLLLIPGLLIFGLAVAIGLAPPSGGEMGNLGQVLAPYVAVIGLVPLLVGLAILRHHRVAQVLGVLVGGLYGAFFTLASLSGNLVTLLLGLAFILAAFTLLSSLRNGER